MPFFNESKGVTIKNAEMKDVGGNMYHYDHSSHISNRNSGNNTTYNTKDSYNNSSMRQYGGRKTHNYVVDSRNINTAIQTSVEGNRRPVPPRSIPATEKPQRKFQEEGQKPEQKHRQRIADEYSSGETDSKEDQPPRRTPGDKFSQTHSPGDYILSPTLPSPPASPPPTSKPFKSNNPFAKMMGEHERMLQPGGPSTAGYKKLPENW